MGLTKTSDGRYLVGLGIEDTDNYKGSQGYRDLVIQLTADGATDDSIEKLNYLREYAIYHSGQGNPVMPPSVSVWISNNGTTTAVEADDISYTDGVYTICGIKYEDGAWDFTNAGQGGGGGSSLPPVTADDNGDVLAVVDGAWSKAPAPSSLPPYTSADKGKGLFLAEDAEHTTTVTVVPEQTLTLGESTMYQLNNVTYDPANMKVGDEGTLYIGFGGNTYDYPMTVVSYMGSNGYSWVSVGGESLSVGYVEGLGGWILITQIIDQPFGDGDTVTVSLTASVPSVEPKWEGLIPPFSASDDEKSLAVSVTKEIVTVMPDQMVAITGGAADVTGVTATRENHTDSCTLVIGSVPINLPDWVDAPQGYGFTNQADGYALIYNSSSEKWRIKASGMQDGSYLASAFSEEVTDISTVWRRIIPDYSLADEGDVLTIENGVPVWKQTSPK